MKSTMALGWHCQATRVPGYTVVMHRAQAGADSGLHTVEAPIIAVPVAGQCSTTFGDWHAEASSTVAWIEPASVPRRNRAGRTGALLLSIVPDHGDHDVDASPRVINDVLIAHDALRAFVEISHGRDSLAHVALHGHILTLVSRLERDRRPPARDRPRWLMLARDYVHAHYRATFELEDVAVAVGVTAPHLARTFRARYRVTVGDYARRLRILWAAEQLSRRGETIAAVSLAAGFFDQSHFSREFRRQLGITPAHFRRMAGKSV